MPGLMLLRLQYRCGDRRRDERHGHGETYYIPHAVGGRMTAMHDWMARRLLGSDCCADRKPLAVFVRTGHGFRGVGAELRASRRSISRCWDILGQLTEQPMWQLLGGPVRDRIPVYNSCGGPSYGGVRRQRRRCPVRPRRAGPATAMRASRDRWRTTRTASTRRPTWRRNCSRKATVA